MILTQTQKKIIKFLEADKNNRLYGSYSLRQVKLTEKAGGREIETITPYIQYLHRTTRTMIDEGVIVDDPENPHCFKLPSPEDKKIIEAKKTEAERKAKTEAIRQRIALLTAYEKAKTDKPEEEGEINNTSYYLYHLRVNGEWERYTTRDTEAEIMENLRAYKEREPGNIYKVSKVEIITKTKSTTIKIIK